MIINGIVCGVFGLITGCFIVRSRHYKKKWKDLRSEYNKRCEELEHALGEVGRDKILIESMQESNADLVERIGEYKHLMTSGCRNMKVLEHILPELANIPQGVVVVAGVDTRQSDLYFPIKTFLYDVNDPSDREFAIREAEELIETIQKA